MRREKTNAGKMGLLVALVIAVVGGISFGYAQLSETLTINGTAKIKKATWNVNLQDVQLQSGSVLDEDNTVQIFATDANSTVKEYIKYNKEDGNIVSASTEKADGGKGLLLKFNTVLKEPGKNFTFNFKVANDGSLDAKLSNVRESGTEVENDDLTVVQTADNHVTTLVKKYAKASCKGTGNQLDQPYFQYSITGIPSLNTVLAGENNYTVTVAVSYPDMTNAECLYDGASDFEFGREIKLDYVQNQ